MIGDFFDDGFDADDAALIGGLAGMIEEEAEDEWRRRCLERSMFSEHEDMEEDLDTDEDLY